MELDVTEFAKEELGAISGSIAELGPNAARITWRNALEAAQDVGLTMLPGDAPEMARQWLRGFGAWTVEELAALPDREIRALVLQFIAGDLREAEDLCGRADGGIDWEQYTAMAECGTVGGRLYAGDNGQIYFYMGD